MGETIFYNGSLRRTPDDVKPVLIGMEVVCDATAKENQARELPFNNWSI